ncbi:DUF1947 domain-containing protein [Candidatus Thorarchaeota archaeon]|nr:MAG: DUF1947 domain-containing protein [Candidatus Thorarchaeota archaeon]
MPSIERIKKRHLLKKRDHREEVERIEKKLGSLVGLGEDDRFEEGILDDGTRILILDDDILFFEKDGRLFPTVHALLKDMVKIPEVTVDMGAVRFVVNGADIMRPGIIKIDDGIEEDSVVGIIEERHGKALAVGVAQLNSQEMRSIDTGKVILSVHHVNDELWDFSKE